MDLKTEWRNRIINTFYIMYDQSKVHFGLLFSYKYKINMYYLNNKSVPFFDKKVPS